MSTIPHDTLETRLGELTAQLGAVDHALDSCAKENRRLIGVIGTLQADLADVAKQRDALKRLVDEAEELKNRQLAAIDRVRHGGLHLLLRLGHDVNDLERLLNASDCSTEAADAAVHLLGTSSHEDAERRLRMWITGK